MEINLFQVIVFFLALTFSLFVAYKLKIHAITNFFLGGLILILLCNCDFLGFKGDLDVFSFAFIILAYCVLSISSLLTLMLKGKQQKYFFLFPICAFIIISLFFKSMFNDVDEQVFVMGILLRLFLSFFPLLLCSYVLKFKKALYDRRTITSKFSREKEC